MSTGGERTDRPRVCFLGAGTMAGAVIGGMLSAGWPADRITATHRRPEGRAAVAEKYGIEVTETSPEAVADADLVVVAVKPYAALDVLASVVEGLSPHTVVASLCAGITCAAMESALESTGRVQLARLSVVRVMPNTACLVRAGVSGISAGRHADEQALARVVEVMQTVGSTVEIPEAQQDALAAVSGSGGAYLALVAEAMIEAGVHQGLPRTVADDLVRQTFAGAAALLVEGEHPAVLREQVTSPAGSTAAAINALESAGVRAAFLSAIAAATERNRALGAPADESR
ncbi:pyrroline-5-carboxylate reductase [Parenemella sanctibonifatiensis]|uniref:Pyrroline-5-carboxylate reductase n=1 Tax=Parenemella sanctibonifatiensis TaxID=2016505 RepID=A0A255EMW2_9ACTN|nr:pyrroline-5-carboxylate reductase [Parenemella sanctibonifatiensis]OYN92550.1 pyrroline-5-carboxylate reductase [Parenemella sanctibonifatiensis]